MSLVVAVASRRGIALAADSVIEGSQSTHQKLFRSNDLGLLLGFVGSSWFDEAQFVEYCSTLPAARSIDEMAQLLASYHRRSVYARESNEFLLATTRFGQPELRRVLDHAMQDWPPPGPASGVSVIGQRHLLDPLLFGYHVAWLGALIGDLADLERVIDHDFGVVGDTEEAREARRVVDRTLYALWGVAGLRGTSFEVWREQLQPLLLQGKALDRASVEHLCDLSESLVAYACQQASINQRMRSLVRPLVELRELVRPPVWVAYSRRGRSDWARLPA